MTIKVTDSNNRTQTRTYSAFNIYPQLQITGGSLHQGEKGVTYGSVPLTATGGKPGTQTWTLTGSTGLGPASGSGTSFTVTGTPTAAGTAVVTLKDAFNTAGVPQSATIFTNIVLTANPTPQSCPKLGGVCTRTIGTLSGGTGGYACAPTGCTTSGAPPGMTVSVSGSSVIISGNPLTASIQTYTFTVNVRDGCSCTANGTDAKSLSLQIT
jgi:hypothetical protein